jgi:sulfotransferase family protein
MGLAVLGAGFGRTGTLSLKIALEQLGSGPCYHMSELLRDPERASAWTRAALGSPVDWDAVLAGYGSAVDWPACAFWHELLVAYPECKVVLSLRDPVEWYASFESTVLPRLADRSPARFTEPHGRRMSEMLERVILDRSLRGRADPAAAISAYESHNDAVRATVPPEQLLEYKVAEGWTPLCDFLGVSPPLTPFPRTNTTDGFWSSFGVGAAPRN